MEMVALDVRELTPHQNVSYPTQSLEFLKHLDSAGRAAPASAVRLDIVIIGAGLGGLATAIALALKGHKVTVLEQAAALGEVRCSLQYMFVHLADASVMAGGCGHSDSLKLESNTA